MAETVSPDKIDELEKRIKTLELMVDEKLREKIVKGLKQEKEGKMVSLEGYEERYKDWLKMDYEVFLTEQSAKDLQKLDADIGERIRKKIKE